MSRVSSTQRILCGSSFLGQFTQGEAGANLSHEGQNTAAKLIYYQHICAVHFSYSETSHAMDIRLHRGYLCVCVREYLFAQRKIQYSHVRIGFHVEYNRILSPQYIKGFDTYCGKDGCCG